MTHSGFDARSGVRLRGSDGASSEPGTSATAREFAGLVRRVESLRGSVDDLRAQLVAVPLVHAGDISGTDRQYYVTFLGAFSVRRGGEVLTLTAQHAAIGLCRFLLARAGTPIPRVQLVEMLWPEADPTRAQHRLHNAISDARRMLDRPHARRSIIALVDERYVVASDEVLSDYDLFQTWYDVARRAVAACDTASAVRAFRSALALHAGEFLADDPYASWAQAQRVHVSERRLTALTFLCEDAAREDDLLAVLEYAQLILDIDELRERAHRHLMRAHHLLGQRGCALRQYRRCEELLRRELDTEPSRATRELLDAIRRDATLPAEIPLKP